MKYINLLTGKQADELPSSAVIDGKPLFSIAPLPIELCAKVGWREMPDSPTAAAGTKIVSVTWVQDGKNPLRVTPIIESKTDAAIAQEKADAEKAAADAEAARVAERQKWIDDIVQAFPDQKQADAIRLLAEKVRPW